MSKRRSTVPIPPIDFEQAFRAVDTFATARNIPALTYPQGEQRAPDHIQMHRLNFDVTDPVMRDLKKRALDGGITVRAVVMRALMAAGVPVPERDLQGDGRRAKRASS